MKSLQNLVIGILVGLIPSEIVRQYEPWIGYIIYSCIFLVVCLTIYIYWVNRIKIEITRQSLDDIPYSVNFTATNMGEHRNSLDEKVILTCLMVPLRRTILYSKKRKFTFFIDIDDRSLEPHIPKKFQALLKTEIPQLFASSFRRYRFIPSRGMYTHVYFEGPLSGKSSYLSFYIARFLHQYLRKDKQVKEITN